jgi:hypothetical protein
VQEEEEEEEEEESDAWKRETLTWVEFSCRWTNDMKLTMYSWVIVFTLATRRRSFERASERVKNQYSNDSSEQQVAMIYRKERTN